MQSGGMDRAARGLRRLAVLASALVLAASTVAFLIRRCAQPGWTMPPSTWQGMPAALEVAANSVEYRKGGTSGPGPSLRHKYGEPVDSPYSFRLAVDLLRSLTSAQRARFQRGATLPFTELRPDQQAALKRAAAAVSSVPAEGVLDRTYLWVGSPRGWWYQINWCVPDRNGYGLALDFALSHRGAGLFNAIASGPTLYRAWVAPARMVIDATPTSQFVADRAQPYRQPVPPAPGPDTAIWIPFSELGVGHCFLQQDDVYEIATGQMGPSTPRVDVCRVQSARSGGHQWEVVRRSDGLFVRGWCTVDPEGPIEHLAAGKTDLAEHPVLIPIKRFAHVRHRGQPAGLRGYAVDEVSIP